MILPSGAYRRAKQLCEVYERKDDLKRLLGSEGIAVLHKVVRLAKDLAVSRQWPLTRVDTRPVRDPDVSDWEYVLVVLAFACSFEAADSYLHEFYHYVDNLGKKLPAKETGILERLVFFDIQVTA